MASSWKFGDCFIEGIQSSNNSHHHCHYHVKIDGEDTLLHPSTSTSVRIPVVYLGETIYFDAVIRKPGFIVDGLYWKNLVSKISCQVLMIPVEEGVTCSYRDSTTATDTATSNASAKENVIQQEGSEKDNSLQSTGNENDIQCSLLSTITGNTAAERESLSEPYFRDDDTFVFPMSCGLHGGLSGTFKFVELQVTLSLFSLNSGKWQNSSPDNTEDVESEEELDIFEEMGMKNKSKGSEQSGNERTNNASSREDNDRKNVEADVKQESSGIHSVLEKTILQRIKVESLPHVKMKIATAGPKHFLLLTIGNHTGRQVVIKSMDLLSQSLALTQEGNAEFSQGLPKTWESCPHLASLEHPKRNVAFPAMLSPMEELSLVFRLHLSSTSDMEYIFRCSMKWTHAGASREISSNYKLPVIKVRHPLFIVTARCEEEPVINQTFSVTYNISNHLYDFMSMKLYYNGDNIKKTLSDKGSSVSEEEKLRVNQLKNAVICHDPVIHTSSCPKGSSIPVTVGFQIHQPGLYEMNELMKVNLGYSLFDTSPDNQTNNNNNTSTSSRSDSTDTISSNLSTEEQLAASRQLWQNRSGSSASLINTTTDEKRKKFAGKSYSFGDLGPSGGSFSDVREGPSSRPRTFKRSSAVPPPRPPLPRKLSQVEQDLINPANFLKTPFYVYIQEQTL